MSGHRLLTDPRRARLIRPGEPRRGAGPVVYWMRRNHRAEDNPGLQFAQDLARPSGAPVVAAYVLAPAFLGAALRQYAFLWRGLAGTAHALRRRGVHFELRQGQPGRELARLLTELGAAALVADFDPLRPKRAWLADLLAETPGLPVWEADGRNIVPAWLASTKQEYMARTLRPKIHRLLPEFLPDVGPEPDEPPDEETGAAPDLAELPASLSADPAVPEATWLEPGEAAARAALARFTDRLAGYAGRRNDPNAGAVSLLSPYLHFGQLSARRTAQAVMAADAPPVDKAAFLEELIVRRELADNFCLYNPAYDSPAGFPAWAKASHQRHADDPRPQRYDLAELEAGRTHDPLWNAAQLEMVRRGYMHGYMRMYWAKKLLEWSISVQEAMDAAIRLNDRYQLDGRDANGYAGIAWSLGGVHDRPWPERAVFGTVRTMTARGAAAKFDVRAYAASVAALPAPPDPAATRP